MSAEQRLRRRLFEGLAEDNLELIHNQPRGTIRRQREARLERLRRLRRAMLAGGSLVVVAGVVLTLALLTDARADRTGPEPEPVIAAALPAPPAADGSQPSSGLAEVLSGQRARAIDPGVIPLAVRTVALDPGHGGRDGGTHLPLYGLLEKDVTWDVADRLRAILEDDFVVVMTRDGDQAVDLSRRTEIANAAGADVFVSIHVNWLPDREARGFETYFAGATVDPFLERLAASENSGSGFSVADTRRLLEGIYSGVRQQESRRLAEWVGSSLFDTLRLRNPAVVDRGVMRAPFVVLVATDMPAVLAEVACISNDREARLLDFPWYRQSIAEALANGIRGYAAEVGPSHDKEST